MRDNRGAVRQRVGRNVRQVRRLRSLTQEALAERSGISYKHLGLIERGRANVGLDVLTRIASALDVDVVDLVERHQPGRRRIFLIAETQITRVRDAIRELEAVATQHRRRRQR